MIGDPDAPRALLGLLVAAKGPGGRPGRVWRHRGAAFLLDPRGTIRTVTGGVRELERRQLLTSGTQRALGGMFVVPTQAGYDMIERAYRPLKLGDR